VQSAKAAPSSLHSNVDPASVDVKLKPAAVWFVGFAGPAVMVVFGGVRSIVQLYVAGVGSAFPTASSARTRKVRAPSERPLYV
jgi:hypothetical protein